MSRLFFGTVNAYTFSICPQMNEDLGTGTAAAEDRTEVFVWEEPCFWRGDDFPQRQCPLGDRCPKPSGEAYCDEPRYNVGHPEHTFS